LEGLGGLEGAVLRSVVLDASGAEVARVESSAKIAALQQTLLIRQAQLWSPDSPVLYTLLSEVLVGQSVVDSERTTFGIRSISADAEHGLRINGVPLKMKGGCIHHDHGPLGAASYDRAEERKIELLKSAGYNAIRCAHNPPAPAFLDACDRLGMLVIDEAFDCWRDGKNLFDYHVSFDDWWQRDLNSMLLRDRNHPSIILWSIGNEVLERDRPEGAQIAQMLASHVRSVDPTRPVTSAICGTWTGKDWDANDATFAALDVGGYNYQWKQYEPDHTRFPQRLMAGTESFPLEALDNWQAVEAHPYVLGDFVWTSLDYLGESGIGHLKDPKDPAFLGGYPWHQANCGDIDLCGFKRPQSYYRDMVWGAGTQLYFAVHTPNDPAHELVPTLWGWPDVWPNWTWPGHEGESLQVEVYSACEAVELFVNGQSLGKQPVARYSAAFAVPYQPGELRAVGYQAGEPACEALLKTVGAAAQLRLTADRTQIQAQTGDLGYITVEVCDASGQLHPVDDRLVRYRVEGPAELIAVGSSNPVSEEDYCASQRTTYRGRGLAVVRSNGTPGTITLHAEADGLQTASVEIAAVSS
jgi:beta-galactosidase